MQSVGVVVAREKCFQVRLPCHGLATPAACIGLTPVVHSHSLSNTLNNKQKDDIGFASAAAMGILVRLT